MTTTTTSNTAALPTPAIIASAIYSMSKDELKAIHQTVKRCLRLTRLMESDNLNVVSVRLSLDTCSKVRRLAVARHGTLSDVVRDAIDDYCAKEN